MYNYIGAIGKSIEQFSTGIHFNTYNKLFECSGTEFTLGQCEESSTCSHDNYATASCQSKFWVYSDVLLLKNGHNRHL